MPKRIMTAVRFQPVSQSFVNDMTTAPMAPPRKPRPISRGPCKALMSTSPFPTASPMNMENPEMATTSSKEAAATTSEGMPFSTPNPRLCRLNMPPTTTAGDTAPKMKPIESARKNGMPKIPHARPAEASASLTPGRTVRRTTANPILLTAPKSISKPPLIRMFIRPKARTPIPQDSGRPRARSPQFFTTIPESNMPRRGGRPTSCMSWAPILEATQSMTTANPLS
mmetsp:Transcript_36640/g.66421  ORF Transcript_36640/g.66421 Transcript_36640/m.66421 type:complete len:226 (-) Transcript_36640:375-1052(-)